MKSFPIVYNKFNLDNVFWLWNYIKDCWQQLLNITTLEITLTIRQSYSSTCFLPSHAKLNKDWLFWLPMFLRPRHPCSLYLAAISFCTPRLQNTPSRLKQLLTCERPCQIVFLPHHFPKCIGFLSISNSRQFFGQLFSMLLFLEQLLLF